MSRTHASHVKLLDIEKKKVKTKQNEKEKKVLSMFQAVGSLNPKWFWKWIR